jgi:hypothetical protein
MNTSSLTTASMAILCLGAGIAACVGAVPTAPGRDSGEEDVMTPHQIYRDKVEGQVRVEFVVGATSIELPTVMEAKDRPLVQGTDGRRTLTRLLVTVNKQVETRLKQLGIEDLRRHLYGKQVRVSGNLKRIVDAGGDGNKLITYSLSIDKLDQLESIKHSDEGVAPGANR